MEAMATRESILKNKLACPSCGRLVTAKFLASRHVCEKKRLGAPPGSKRRPKTESEIEEWTAKVQEKAVQAFLQRTGKGPDAMPEDEANADTGGCPGL
jgi:hypothetical protein